MSHVANHTARAALAYARDSQSRFVQKLTEFLRFASVSAQPQHAPDLHLCAEWLAAHLHDIGLHRARVIPTGGAPLVSAVWRSEDRLPTILIYGHYDVQPPEPLDQWHTHPFAPVVVGGAIYGRGAADDKGQMFTHVNALESYLHTSGHLPVNVICLFEGEEETGSANLTRYLAERREPLAADVIVVSDMTMAARDLPAITYSLRGSLGLDLEVHGPENDLHSGMYGGAVHNPLQVLCDLVSGLHDAGGRINIPDFYRRVRFRAADERHFMARNGPSTPQLLRNARAAAGWGEPGYSAYERVTIRPSLSIHGISSGYSGPGRKAVIPAHATAKLSFRLVPDQQPTEIERLFKQHIARVAPSTVQALVRVTSRAAPVSVDRTQPILACAQTALARAFGNTPAFLRSGGTIPIVSHLQQQLQAPAVLMGFALRTDGIHAPNEMFQLSNFYRGTAASIWFLNEAAHCGMSRSLSTMMPTAARRLPSYGPQPEAVLGVN